MRNSVGDLLGRQAQADRDERRYLYDEVQDLKTLVIALVHKAESDGVVKLSKKSLECVTKDSYFTTEEDTFNRGIIVRAYYEPPKTEPRGVWVLFQGNTNKVLDILHEDPNDVRYRYIHE